MSRCSRRNQFPRGATPGTFLHSLFEELDFTQPLDEQWLLAQLQQHGFAEHWQPILLAWMRVLLNTPLADSGVTLAALTPQHKQVEMEFYLPINRLLQAKELDALVNRYDPLSAGCPPLDFRQVQGMLKGFIDLVFRHAQAQILPAGLQIELAGRRQQRLYPAGDGAGDGGCIATICSTSFIPWRCIVTCAIGLPDYHYRRAFWRRDLPVPARRGCGAPGQRHFHLSSRV